MTYMAFNSQSLGVHPGRRDIRRQRTFGWVVQFVPRNNPESRYIPSSDPIRYPVQWKKQLLLSNITSGKPSIG